LTIPARLVEDPRPSALALLEQHLGDGGAPAPEGDRGGGEVQPPRAGPALADQLHRLGVASLHASEPLQKRAGIEGAERLDVQHPEPGALRGGYARVRRRKTGVGEDFLLDESAMRAL